MGKLWTAMWVLGAAALGACGGSSGGGSSGNTGIPVEQSQFASRFAQSVCSSMASCCSANSFAYDAATCVNAMKGQLDAALLQYKGLQVRYDSTAASACVNAYSSALRACNDTLSSVDDPCKRIFAGTVALGGACTESQECADTPQPAMCSGGKCVVNTYTQPATGALGAACIGTCTRDGSGYSCAGSASTGTGGSGNTGNTYCFTNDGLHCASATHQCEALPTLGQPCAQDGCAGANYCQAGVCAPQQDSGPCADSRTCTATSFCDATTHQCLPKLADGQPCRSDDNCKSGNCDNGLCKPRIPVDASLCAGLLN